MEMSEENDRVYKIMVIDLMTKRNKLSKHG